MWHALGNPEEWEVGGRNTPDGMPFSITHKPTQIRFWTANGAYAFDVIDRNADRVGALGPWDRRRVWPRAAAVIAYYAPPPPPSENHKLFVAMTMQEKQ